MSGGANSACAARRFAREAFAHEPIHHQLGLNLKLGWCGLHDCAGPPSLPARNPAVNFGCDWWVVDVAVDRGAIRHDALPQAKWTTAKARIKGCYRRGALTIGPKGIVLEYTVPMAPRDGPSDLCEPCRCSLERLDQRPRGERLCKIGETPGLMRGNTNGRVVVPQSSRSSSTTKTRLRFGKRASSTRHVLCGVGY